MSFRLIWEIDEAHNKISDVVMVEYDALTRACCRSADLKSVLTPEELSTGAFSEADAYLPAEHWAEHEFKRMNDESVTETALGAGIHAAAVGPGQEPPWYTQSEMERAQLRRELVPIELVRRGFDPIAVAGLADGSWWPEKR